MKILLIVTSPKTKLSKIISCFGLTKRDVDKTVKFYRRAKYEIAVI
jgi:hypothetical protein